MRTKKDALTNLCHYVPDETKVVVNPILNVRIFNCSGVNDINGFFLLP